MASLKIVSTTELRFLPASAATNFSRLVIPTTVTCNLLLTIARAIRNIDVLVGKVVGFFRGTAKIEWLPLTSFDQIRPGVCFAAEGLHARLQTFSRTVWGMEQRYFARMTLPVT